MLAVALGEPAGIGPDLVLALTQTERPHPWFVVGDAGLLETRAAALGIPLSIDDNLSRPAGAAGYLTVRHTPLAGSLEPGTLDTANVPGVLESLDVAIDGCLRGKWGGLVTGPLQKSIINDAGVAFTGHTEYLAAAAGADDVVMLLVAGDLRVALATTHLPLRAVADAIDATLLARCLTILRDDLQSVFGIASPHILVAGLNPHAGEGGHLGREELDVIGPVCDRLRGQGFVIEGPLPADTLFTEAYLDRADAVLAMYHDQGLPVLKHAGFGRAVNVTLGLPFVRTSVDHGTALDLAGTGRADPGSFAEALALAARLELQRARA